MATAAEWATRTAELEQALHDLAVGARVVRIQAPDGTTTEYGLADIDKLTKLLEFYKGQAARASTTIRGPVYITPRT